MLKNSLSTLKRRFNRKRANAVRGGGALVAADGGIDAEVAAVLQHVPEATKADLVRRYGGGGAAAGSAAGPRKAAAVKASASAGGAAPYHTVGAADPMAVPLRPHRALASPRKEPLASAQFASAADEIADVLDTLNIELETGLPSADGVLRMRDLLRTRGAEWVAKFQAAGGLEVIALALGAVVDARAAAAARHGGTALVREQVSTDSDTGEGGGGSGGRAGGKGAFYSFSSMRSVVSGAYDPELPEVEVDLVYCLMLLLNGGGLEVVAQVTTTSALLPVVANCTTMSPSAYVRGSGMRVMTVIASGGARGRDMVLKSLDHVRLERDDAVRFVTLTDTLSDEEMDVAVKVDTMVLVNALLCLEETEARRALRGELHDAGMLEAIDAMKDKYGQAHVDMTSDEAAWEALIEGRPLSGPPSGSPPGGRRGSGSRRNSLNFIRESDTPQEREARSELATQIELFESMSQRDEEGADGPPDSESAYVAHAIHTKLAPSPVCLADWQAILAALDACAPSPHLWKAAAAAVQAAVRGEKLLPQAAPAAGAAARPNTLQAQGSSGELTTASTEPLTPRPAPPAPKAAIPAPPPLPPPLPGTLVRPPVAAAGGGVAAPARMPLPPPPPPPLPPPLPASLTRGASMLAPPPPPPPLPPPLKNGIKAAAPAAAGGGAPRAPGVPVPPPPPLTLGGAGANAPAPAAAGGAAKASAGAPTMTLVTKQARPKRRTVHWDKLEPSPKHGLPLKKGKNGAGGSGGDGANPPTFSQTVFAELRPSSVLLPVDKLRAAFEEKPSDGDGAAAVLSKIAKPVKEHPGASLLDAKTKQNVGIALKKLRMKPARIMEELYSMSDRALTLDNLLALREMAPDAPTVRKLKAYKGSESELDEVTQLLHAIARVPRYEARLDATIFIRAYAEDAERIEGRVKMVHMAMFEALDSKKLPRLLEIVLAMGNFLNEGTAKGNAKGIKLASLLQLETVKTLDRKKTLLHVLVEFARETEPELLQLEEDLENCKEASTIGLDELLLQVNQLRMGFKVVRDELKAASASAGARARSDRFVERAESFLSRNAQEFEDLCAAHARAEGEYRDVARRFGEDADAVTSKAFFGLLSTFVAMLGRAAREVRSWAAEEERRRRRAEKARLAAKKPQQTAAARASAAARRAASVDVEAQIAQGSLAAAFEHIKEGLAREVAIQRASGDASVPGGAPPGGMRSRAGSFAFGRDAASPGGGLPAGAPRHRRLGSHDVTGGVAAAGGRPPAPFGSVKRLRSTTFLPVDDGGGGDGGGGGGQ